MTDAARSNDATPWIVAGALGIVAIVLAAVVLFVIYPDKHDKQKLANARGLTTTEQQAVDAASKQALNLTTYARKTFEADYARALAGATGAFAKDLQDTTKKAALLKQMNDGKFDLQGSVSNAAFETVADGKYSVLVLTQSYQLLADNKKSAPTQNRFLFTMQHTGGKWLASDLQAVGLI